MSRTSIPDQRAIVDRRALAGAIADLVAEKGGAAARPAVGGGLGGAQAAGRGELAGRRAFDRT
ncbi:MAG: hypothetical protein ACK5B7_10490 [Novosphingobium sp.]